jgi:DMSO/TMAO reductase YedYZ molybdopterin-dependent catalytic subunit
MRTPARTSAVVALLTVALGTTALLSACSAPASKPRGDFPTSEMLAPSQVSEYKGQRLDSITGFRENSIKGPQYIDITRYRLTVDGLVSKPASYTYDQVLTSFKHYSKVVRLDCVEGWSVNILWEGPLVREILASSSPLPQAKVVIFHAVDGYSTSFPIEYMTGNDRIMAYKINGVVLPAERGYPFMLVAEDKWGYKWCKWITHIEISSNADYRGYWESRGYSNDGSLKNDFFTK